MSHRYYHLCRANIGRPVRIRTHDGRWHMGTIGRVSPSGVYLAPFGRQISDEKAYKQKDQAKTLKTNNEKEKGTEVQWGYGYGYGGYWLTWAAIATLFLLPFFFI